MGYFFLKFLSKKMGKMFFLMRIVVSLHRI